MDVDSSRGTEPTVGAAAGTPAQATRVRGPRWKDARLVVGLLLVLGSVAAGVQVFSAADRTTAVWAAARDLDAGAVLGDGDVVKRQVRLLDATDEYLAAGSVPTRYVVTRAVGRGELLPSAAVRSPGRAQPRRLVTVPVGRGHLPTGLAAGRRVDVYVMPKEEAGDGGDRAADLVVAGATVVDPGDSGQRLGAATADVGVMLSVAPRDVGPILEAVRRGDVDLVGLPLGAKSDGDS